MPLAEKSGDIKRRGGRAAVDVLDNGRNLRYVGFSHVTTSGVVGLVRSCRVFASHGMAVFYLLFSFRHVGKSLSNASNRRVLIVFPSVAASIFNLRCSSVKLSTKNRMGETNPGRAVKWWHVFS